MNSKNKKTLDALFAVPVPSGIRWEDIETLFASLGGEVSDGRGSRIRVTLHGVHAVFHRPHPQPTTDKGAAEAVKRFLENAGVQP
jgi:hypothetical protein